MFDYGRDFSCRWGKMKGGRSKKPVVPARVLLRSLIPFGVPVLLTLAMLAIAGSGFPRDIAPGSGLKLVGLLATLVTTALAWRLCVEGISDARVRTLAGVFCLLVGLISWPVWSMGVLPFVNAFALQNEQNVAMTLDRTEVTPIRLSDQKQYWAWLTPNEAETGILPGRHVIPKTTYDLWTAARPETVVVQTATGLLGATVVIAIQSR